MKRAIILIAISALDLNSYCKGVCQARYQDGIYMRGKCACIDYQPVNLPQRFTLPKRAKVDFDEPSVYDGKDEMHIPSPDSEPRTDSLF